MRYHQNQYKWMFSDLPVFQLNTSAQITVVQVPLDVREGCALDEVARSCKLAYIQAVIFRKGTWEVAVFGLH